MQLCTREKVNAGPGRLAMSKARVLVPEMPVRAQVRYAGEAKLGPGKAELLRTEERILDAREVDPAWAAAMKGEEVCCSMQMCMLDASKVSSMSGSVLGRNKACCLS